MKKIIIIIAIVLAAGAGLWFYITFKSGCVLKEGSVYVPTGGDYAGLLDSLECGGNIQNMGQFRLTARLLGLDDVKPGRYVLKKGMSYKAAVWMFRQGYQTPVRLTFNNMRTLPQLAGRVAAQIEPDSATVAAALAADTVAARYGFDRRTFIAMFIPDTYEFYWNTTPQGFLERMNKEYGKFWNAERTAKLERAKLSKTEVATLASIVYEETKKTDEMPIMAGVYMNRLRIGMPLQADPTVRFATGDFALRRVKGAHLDVESPYNTYKYAGLPPGPICMPSVAAVDAVLDFRAHKYFYFCARSDFSGYHNFAATLDEHNRNSAAYHKALNAREIR